MPHLDRWRIWLMGATIAAVAWSAWVMAQRHLGGAAWRVASPRQDARAAQIESVYGGSDLKILQFYSRDAVAYEGVGTLLCYSVLNATAVRIDPPVEGVYPALSKCVQVVPLKDTKYTLTAEGAGGRKESVSFTVAVRPNPDTLPKITAFNIRQHRVVDGRHVYTLYFWTENAQEISIDPPVFPPHPSHFGIFPVMPVKTTTYTLTASGKFGHKAHRQLTVQAP